MESMPIHGRTIAQGSGTHSNDLWKMILPGCSPRAQEMTFDLPDPVAPPVVRLGRLLLYTFVGCLVIGKAIVTIIPGLQGRGFDIQTLSILIPIWTVGISGILLLLVGWIRYPMLETELDADRLNIERRPDGRIFGWLTKSLALLAVALLWLGSLGFLFGVDPQATWTNRVVFYCVTSYCGLVLYLIVFYRTANHHATTTYLYLLTPLFAFLLIPLTWPLLILLNWFVLKRERAAADDAEWWDESVEDRLSGP
jgi:hypothetical protein